MQVHNLGPGCFCCMSDSKSSPGQVGGSEDGVTFIQQNQEATSN